MARPTKPKDLKPKVEGEAAAAPAAAGGGLDLKYIILVVVAIVASILGSAGSAYLMTTLFVMPEITKVAASATPAGEGGEAHTGPDGASTETPADQVGMNLELDEFTVNLKSDPNMDGNQFLRAKMALSIKVPEKENCYAEHAAATPPLRLEGGKVVGAAVPVDHSSVDRPSVDRSMLAEEGALSCEQIFKNNMGKYVPTIRDVINASLMKRTATTLATLEGQESLKDEIKTQLSQILAPNYEVLRVNFQDFIIQK